MFGAYRLRKLIGKGGMGRVFAATHVRLGREVAVKVLAPHLVADPQHVSRFLHEARIVNEIRHPNIIDVVDFLELKDPPRVAFVMELINGPSLREVLRRKRLTMSQVLNLGVQLIDAIRAVHAIKVVHRDLKPDNILVVDPESDFSTVPAIKILDFGIAKIFDRESVMETVTGKVVGTPAYMAPEQIAGGPVTEATDTYAIGELLYEMATGARPFAGDATQALRSKLGDPPTPTLEATDFPRATDFASMVRSCLAPEVNARPDLSAVHELLREMLTSSGHTEVLDQMTRIQRPQPLVPPTLTYSGPDTSSDVRSVSPMLATPMAHYSVIDPSVSRFALIAACVVLVVVGLGAGLMIHSLFRTNTTPTVIVAKPPPPEEIAPKAAEVAPPPATPPPAEPPPPAEQKRASSTIVELDSDPTGVSVFDVESGRLLGKTPIEIAVQGGTQKSVRLQRAGFVAKTVVLDSSIERRTVKLSRSKRTGPLDERETLPW